MIDIVIVPADLDCQRCGKPGERILETHAIVKTMQPGKGPAFDIPTGWFDVRIRCAGGHECVVPYRPPQGPSVRYRATARVATKAE